MHPIAIGILCFVGIVVLLIAVVGLQMFVEQRRLHHGMKETEASRGRIEAQRQKTEK